MRLLPANGLLLEGGLILYVVDLQARAVDDRQVVRLVERWSAERCHHPHRRVTAVLVAAGIGPRYRNVLAAIGGAVPIIAMELELSSGSARFTLMAL